MKLFAARRRAIAAVALVLAAATLPAVAGDDVPILAGTLVLCLLAAAIAVHDLATMLIPDRYTLGVAFVALFDWWWESGDPQALAWRVGVAFATMLGLWLFDLCYGLLRGRAGLGFGDVKLIGASAALLGLAGVGMQIFLAAAAALFFILFRAFRRRRSLRAAARIPFGTFLAPAVVLVWAWLPSPW